MTTTRPRGFISNWKPHPHVAKLIGQVNGILSANHDILPLTIRQIFYMLVSNHEYDKTEKAYKRLCETLNKARRARMIHMSSIRDDGMREQTPFSYRSERDCIDVIKAQAEQFRLPRQRGQDSHLIVWCEAGGMLPQLARYCDQWGVPVRSSGGFDSVTTKHDFAKHVSRLGHVEILHIGDHDPSGVHMCKSLDEDLNAFVRAMGGDVEVTRLAVTPEQVATMRLPTAPPKATDNRSFTGKTTQAEAIPPAKLREIVTAAITDRIDIDIYNDILDQERVIRESLAERLEHL